MKPRWTVPPEKPVNDAGSPLKGEPVFLVVGKLRRAHGLAGDILMEVITDFPERMRSGRELFIGEEHMPVHLQKSHVHPPFLLLKFREFDTPDEVGKFRNSMVYVRADNLPPLPEGEYYQHQLVGLQVVTEDGQSLGILTEVLETGANDVYIVKTADGNEVLLPAIREVIQRVDLAEKTMIVRPQTWQD
ncbi:MAG TPA: ribosome maturation factor RimM [Longilinea sp.]|nr:ribosome maturation factor RimM [Longilinea sp.]